jgi:hypothetical protein
MNAKVFKQLIKEAVREAVREEVGVLLLEQKKQTLSETKTFNFASDDVPVGNIDAKASLRSKLGNMFGYDVPQPQTQLQVDPTSDNPFAAFIADAGANMTAQDLSGLRNLG